MEGKKEIKIRRKRDLILNTFSLMSPLEEEEDNKDDSSSIPSLILMRILFSEVSSSKQCKNSLMFLYLKKYSIFWYLEALLSDNRNAIKRELA